MTTDISSGIIEQAFFFVTVNEKEGLNFLGKGFLKYEQDFVATF